MPTKLITTLLQSRHIAPEENDIWLWLFASLPLREQRVLFEFLDALTDKDFSIFHQLLKDKADLSHQFSKEKIDSIIAQELKLITAV